MHLSSHSAVRAEMGCRREGVADCCTCCVLLVWVINLELNVHTMVYFYMHYILIKYKKKISWKNNAVVELSVMRITSVWVITVNTGGLRGDREEEGRSICSYEKPLPRMWGGTLTLSGFVEWHCSPGQRTPQWFNRLWLQYPIPFFGTQTTFM